MTAPSHWQSLYRNGVISLDEYRSHFRLPPMPERQTLAYKLHRESQLVDVWESLDRMIEATRA